MQSRQHATPARARRGGREREAAELRPDHLVGRQSRVDEEPAVPIADQPLEARLPPQPRIVGLVELEPAGHGTTILPPANAVALVPAER